jgi:uncharacterized circularly permuted ATP-grasp superfamily protein
MTETTVPDRQFTDGYDEAFAASGEPRPHYAEILAALEGTDLLAMRDAVNARVAAAGVVFRSKQGANAFLIDPVPRIFGAEEWSALSAGLRQRVKALNAFIHDAYGERRIVEAGRMPADAIDSAQGFERALCGALPPGIPPVGIAGLDIVRDRDGVLRVLEDNLRTPSGVTYADAAREAVLPELPGGVPAYEPLRRPLRAQLERVLREAAPDGVDEPFMAVLTDGPEGSAWYEHSTVARWLGIPAVELDDLEHHRDGLYVRDEYARLRPVDVIYRRSDEDRLRDDDGRLTAVAEALLEPWTEGRLTVVNAFGTGVADDKLVHAYVEDMVRFYLDEEPLLEAVHTYDLGREADREEVLAGLEQFVVKPRTGHGGGGVVVCAHADPHDIERLRRDIAASPGTFIAQPTVAISHHPTVVVPGRLEPRHVDLRPFVYASRSGVEVLAGGLTRVAWDPGALVVNSSQNGGAKDTWVLR